MGDSKTVVVHHLDKEEKCILCQSAVVMSVPDHQTPTPDGCVFLRNADSGFDETLEQRVAEDVDFVATSAASAKAEGTDHGFDEVCPLSTVHARQLVRVHFHQEFDILTWA